MSIQSNKSTRSLYKAILSLESEEECKKFFRDLLTKGEIKEFSARWKVAQLLDSKVPYEKIGKQTGMSSTTIARISKWLNNGMSGYRLVLNKLQINSHHTR